MPFGVEFRRASKVIRDATKRDGNWKAGDFVSVLRESQCRGPGNPSGPHGLLVVSDGIGWERAQKLICPKFVRTVTGKAFERRAGETVEVDTFIDRQVCKSVAFLSVGSLPASVQASIETTGKGVCSQAEFDAATFVKSGPVPLPLTFYGGLADADFAAMPPPDVVLV